MYISAQFDRRSRRGMEYLLEERNET